MNQVVEESGKEQKPGAPPLYSLLGEDDIRYIAAKGSIKMFERGTNIISEGEISDHMYVILTGRVRVFANNTKGKEIILNIQEAGEYFGEIALIDEAPRSASVVAMEYCVMAEVSREVFEQCANERPEIMGSFLSALTQRVRYLTNSVKNFALNDVRSRLIVILQNLAEDQDGEMVVKIPMTHKELSHMVGSSREMVSKIMRDLQDSNVVQCKKQRIVIL